jgi:hypothetical protein
VRVKSAFAALGFTALVFFAASSPASGRLDPDKTMLARSVEIDVSGRVLTVRGRVSCEACNRFLIGVTVTQRASGALALGGIRCRCSGEPREWSALARARTEARFALGKARACAWVVTRGESGKFTDAVQVCRAIELVRRAQT